MIARYRYSVNDEKRKEVVVKLTASQFPTRNPIISQVAPQPAADGIGRCDWCMVMSGSRLYVPQPHRCESRLHVFYIWSPTNRSVPLMIGL